jgi:Raf kinase inhibitor-like YbhB/YbcL family protein
MKRYILLLITIAVVMITSSVSCTDKAPVEVEVPALDISSPAFENGAEIPAVYSCAGLNYSPELTWSKGPEGIREYILIVVDLDTPDERAHWILYNIPPETTELHEGISTNGILEKGIIQGRNYLRKLGYYGPCPPPTETHRYRFTIYATDTFLTLASASKEQVLDAIKGHILARGELTGSFRN